MSRNLNIPGTLAATMTATTPGTVGVLLRLAKMVHRRSTEELLGMRLRQYQLLYAVRESAPMRQQDLCERLWLDPNNCVLLLNEVEALGYVERRRDPEDRWRHVVDITPEGRRALERAEQAQAGLEGEILGALSEEERETLYRLLSKALEAQRG